MVKSYVGGRKKKTSSVYHVNVLIILYKGINVLFPLFVREIPMRADVRLLLRE